MCVERRIDRRALVVPSLIPSGVKFQDSSVCRRYASLDSSVLDIVQVKVRRGCGGRTVLSEIGNRSDFKPALYEPN